MISDTFAAFSVTAARVGTGAFYGAVMWTTHIFVIFLDLFNNPQISSKIFTFRMEIIQIYLFLQFRLFENFKS